MVKKFKLAILICAMPSRADFLLRLMNILLPQKTEDVVILTDDAIGLSIGEKRNRLMKRGVEVAEYVAFIDDDDVVIDNYVQLLMEGINKGVDCCSLRGVITSDGIFPRLFEHSIKYKIYRTVEEDDFTVRYERYPNHLNCIKSEIAGQFQFPEKNHGEDTDWATKIHNSGLLKTEHWIEDIIYYYEYRSKK